MNTETRGFDIVSTYNGVEMAGGSVDFTIAANFTETDVTDIFVPDVGAISSLDSSVVINSQDISIIEEWQPEDRISASALYSRDDWTVNFSLNRFGEYTTQDSGTQTYSAEILTDLFVKYRVNEQISVNFTGNNIFDVTPDEATNGLSRGGLFESSPGAADLGSDSVFRYSRRSAPFGFNGAYYSVGVSYDF
jgi:iron complex outermembrane receptor protein